MPATNKRLITTQDLYRIQTLSSCEISPDGGFVVYCVHRVDRATEKKYSNIWIAPTSGGQPRQFTYSDQNDTRPKWSPDGRQIAFMSNRRDENQSQIFLIPFEGGEARPLTDMKGTFGDFQWSPDGRIILCEFRKKDSDEIDREADEQKKKLGVVARHITRVHFKYDGVGFLPKERWHIWTINARTGRAKQLTDSEIYDERNPRWTPDGTHIVYLSNRTDDPDFNPDADDIFVMPSEGGEPRKIEISSAREPSGKSLMSVSPDGSWISYVGREGQGNWWKNDGVWVIPFDGSDEAANLTKDYDINVSNLTIGDIGESATTPPVWSKDSTRIYFQVTRHGSTLLKSISLVDGDLQPVLNDAGVVGAYSLDRIQSRLAYIHSDAKNIGHIAVLNLKDDRTRRLTRLNQSVLQSDLGEIEEVWFGDYILDTRLHL